MRDLRPQYLTDKENNLVDLQLIRGGKPDFIGRQPPDNWLMALKVNTTFLVKSKNNANFALGEFTLIAKRERSVLLCTQLNQEAFTWVDSVRFVGQYDLAEILYEPEDEPTTEQPSTSE